MASAMESRRSWLFPALRRVDRLTQASLAFAAEQDLTETR
jgi:hypothetical protein